MRRLRLVVLIAAAACAPANPTRHRAVALDDPRTSSARPSDRIDTAELRSIQGNWASEAVRQLRPEFLRAGASRVMRGGATQPSVYIDGRFAGGLDYLATIPIGLVREIRRLSSLDAQIQLGAHCECEGGVIHVLTLWRGG